MERIRNTGTAQVKRFGDKIRAARLRWFGHVWRRDGGYTEQRMLNMEKGS